MTHKLTRVSSAGTVVGMAVGECVGAVAGVRAQYVLYVAAKSPPHPGSQISDLEV